MTSRAHRCEYCGAPANVHVMHEIGRPGSAHHLCMQCADGRGNHHATEQRSLDTGAFVVAGGFFLLTFSIVADQLRLGPASSFDLRQMVFLAVAALVIGSGSLARASSLSVVGLVLLLAVLLADNFELDSRKGLGIPQIAGLVVSCLTIGTGVALGCFSRRPGQPATIEPRGHDS